MDNSFVNFDDLVVTDIEWAGMNHLKRKKTTHMKSRPCYGLSLKLEGLTVYKCEGHYYECSPHKIILYKKGADYQFTIKEFGPCIIINFDLLEGDFGFQSIQIKDNQKYISLCREIIDSFNSEEDGHKLKAKAKLYELLFLIVSEMDSKTTISKNKIDPAIKYINNNIDKKITNSELAKMCFVSEVYLRKLFLKITGVTPQQYVIQRKIKMAKSWLLSTRMAINEIAFKLGYPDVYSFSKSFKIHSGCSPQQFRKQNGL